MCMEMKYANLGPKTPFITKGEGAGWLDLLFFARLATSYSRVNLIHIQGAGKVLLFRRYVARSCPARTDIYAKVEKTERRVVWLKDDSTSPHTAADPQSAPVGPCGL